MTDEPKRHVYGRITRQDINGQIREALDKAGIEGQFRYTDEHGGRMMWFIDGEKMTTGEAADKYLPGGFKGNFGGTGNA